MKILMTALQPGGGIRTFFRYVYSHDCFSDCSFTLIAPDAGLAEFLLNYIPEERLFVIPAATGHLSFAMQVRKELQKGDYDLLHSHGFSAGSISEFARIGCNTPHLMTAHDVFQTSQFAGMKGSLKRWLLATAFGRMTGIHTVTGDARENLLSFFSNIDPARVHDILHGVDTAFFEEGEPRNLKEELGLKPETPLIGFFGRFMGQKGFRVLVDAAEELICEKGPLEAPHVVTFGWGGFVREDYAYLGEKGLDGHFHQMSQTDDMSACLKGVDVVAMPSRWEACGLLAMEALAAGVPIVGTNCIGLREVLKGSPAKMVAVGDSQSLSQVIRDELLNREARKKEFLAYQSTASDRFDIKRPAEALRRVYGQLVITDTEAS